MRLKPEVFELRQVRVRSLYREVARESPCWGFLNTTKRFSAVPGFREDIGCHLDAFYCRLNLASCCKNYDRTNLMR